MTEVVVAFDKKERVDLDWLYKKFKGICWICRKFCPRDHASRDHLIPWSLGGTHDKSNIALAHKKCNQERGNGFKVVHSKHFDAGAEPRYLEVLEELGIYVQITSDRLGGFNVMIAKKND